MCFFVEHDVCLTCDFETKMNIRGKVTKKHSLERTKWMDNYLDKLYEGKSGAAITAETGNVDYLLPFKVPFRYKVPSLWNSARELSPSTRSR